MSSRQPDLFQTNDQADEETETPAYRPDIDSVRAELRDILEEARAAQSLPHAQLSLYRTIFPQMTNWLPEDEAAQLRFEFETELERLKAA